MRRFMKLGSFPMIFLRGCPHHEVFRIASTRYIHRSPKPQNDQDPCELCCRWKLLRQNASRIVQKIIESKSKVRQSRNKAVVAKMSTSSSTQAVSSDVAELKDMVRALILDRKNQKLPPP
ncbi:hypothetical protein Tco_0211811 [Tanacetum coccineum]